MLLVLSLICISCDSNDACKSFKLVVFRNFYSLNCCYDVIESSCLCARIFLHDFFYVILSLIFFITLTNLSIIEKISKYFHPCIFSISSNCPLNLIYFFMCMNIIFQAFCCYGMIFFSRFLC